MTPHSIDYSRSNDHASDEAVKSPVKVFPVANSLQSFWLRYKNDISDHRTTASLPKVSDVVIIGAGYAGTATAYHLLQELPHDQDLSITILEARGACSGATGRNGGHLRPDLYGHIIKHCARGGLDAGREIAEFEIQNMWAIKKLIEEEQIDCDFVLSRAVDVWCNEEAAKQAQKNHDQLTTVNGFEYMRDVFFTSDSDKAENYSGVKGAKAAGSFTAGSLHSFKFITSILRKLINTGKVNLQTHTPVQSVIPGGERFSVNTERGTISAQRVVYATNGYTSGLMQEYSNNIIPCKGICCHIEVPPGKSAPYLGQSFILRAEDTTGSYLISRPDGIIVGGAAAKFRPLRSQWYKNVDDSVLIDAAKDYYEGFMQRTFTGWEDSGARVAKIWTGIMGHSFDTNPHVGPIPAKPNQYILSGFNGHGMPVIFLAAKGLARMIMADRDGQHMTFAETGVPRLFETTQARIDRAKAFTEEQGDVIGTGEFLPYGNSHVAR